MRRVALAALGVATLIGAAASVAPGEVPSPGQCLRLRAHRELAPILSLDPRPGAPRVFAIQFKQELSNVATYAAFHTKIECLIRQYVLPYRARGRANLVVFNEDTGLMTLATGSRGAAARQAFGPGGAPGCEGQGFPCSTLAALGAVTAAYQPQIAAYEARFGPLGLTGAFVGATDTLVRSFMTTFSDLALRYRLYLVASNDQAPFRQSTDPSDIATFHDPDYAPPASVYVATAPQVYNQVFMWGPRRVRSTGPVPLRNVVASNRKVPLTSLEQEIGFAPGPSTGPDATANLRPYRLPGTQARIGFATSLPAFEYGDPPRGSDPCANVAVYYMRCLNRLGANLVIQDEANPGRWTGPDGNGIEQWQPLSWMASTYRAVSDPSVRFAYNVTAMLVGNLADLPFDGQTAITQRHLRTRACHYIGNGSFLPAEDQAQFRRYAGAKPGFLAIAPWVTGDGPRSALRATGSQLAPGSGSPREDDYVESAIVADLPVPVDRHRDGCVTRRGRLG